MKPFIFVIMPFGTKFTEVYRSGITRACAEADVECKRVDEQIFSESVLNKIFKEIERADLIIADMSDRNPNVFFEAGYAIALQKTVIFTVRSQDEIPFDLHHYPFITYSAPSELYDALTRKLAYFLQNPEDPMLTKVRRFEKVYKNPYDYLNDVKSVIEKECCGKALNSPPLTVDAFALDLQVAWPWFEALLREREDVRNLHVRTLVLDPKAKAIRQMSYGGSSAELTALTTILRKISELVRSNELMMVQRNINLQIRASPLPYDIQGSLVGGRHLYLSFVEIQNGKLRGGDFPFRYFPLDEQNRVIKHYFHWYQSWFQYHWDRSKYVVPTAKFVA